jgi:hypothetical protein
VSALEEIEREVRERCDDMMPELLPLVFTRMIERNGMIPCERHTTLIGPYVRAQIQLSRAKRNYYDFDYEGSKAVYQHALELRDVARARYRGVSCNCWLAHR